MEIANKTCKSNPNCNNCNECMKGSPYNFVVKINVVSMSSVEDVLTKIVGNRFEIQWRK